MASPPARFRAPRRLLSILLAGIVAASLVAGVLAGLTAVGLIGPGATTGAVAGTTPPPAPVVPAPVVPAPVVPASVADHPAGTPVHLTAAVATVPKSNKVRKPKAATRTRKARNVPERPRDQHTGKRIVYDKALMTVWLMDKHDNVVARYPVVGRWDRPRKGTYRVLSKSPSSYNPESDVTFQHMVRFAPGLQTGYTIGFHAIPRYRDGKRMHSVKQLGLPIARGGCVRLSDKAAKRVYRFLDVGDLVVVLPSP